MLLQLKAPQFYRGYWQVSIRLPNKTRVKLRRKSRETVLKDYIDHKILALSMLSEEDCPQNVRDLVKFKLDTFYEENL